MQPRSTDSDSDELSDLPIPTGNERRKRNIPVAVDRRRANNAAEKRRTSERRRLIDPTTCERDYTDDETIFMQSMDRYKRENRRPFPSWTEVLDVARTLGYRKVAEETELPGNRKPVPAATPESTAAVAGNERRKRNIPAAVDRRRVGELHAEEQEFTEAEHSFMHAMDRYKRGNRRPFPTWSEVLEVLRALGYRRVAEVTELPNTRGEAAAVPEAETPKKG